MTTLIPIYYAGGRIWWIMREVDKIGSKHRSGALVSKKHYLTTIALVWVFRLS